MSSKSKPAEIKQPDVRTGVIIAGGRSTRFGDRDKAVAHLGDTPMIRRVAGRIAPVIDRLVINCRSDQRSIIESAMASYPHDVQFAIDPEPDAGPLAGIHTAFGEITTPFAAVVACDMPFVETRVVGHLFERARDGDAAVPRIEGWYEPLHAVYRTDALKSALGTISVSDSRIIEVYDELEVIPVDASELEDIGSTRSFENVNTVDEYERAKSIVDNE